MVVRSWRFCCERSESLEATCRMFLVRRHKSAAVHRCTAHHLRDRGPQGRPQDRFALFGASPTRIIILVL
eukprot:321373-Amphidinium_carterae.1